MKKMGFFSLGLVFFLSLSGHAFEWKDLNVYQKTRTKAYVHQMLKSLLRHDSKGETAIYALKYIRITPRSLSVYAQPIKEVPNQTPEYEMEFSDSDEKSTEQVKTTPKLIQNLRISVDSSHQRWKTLEYQGSDEASSKQEIDYEKLVIQISDQLVSLLKGAGANVDVPRLSQEGPMSLQERAAHMNQFSPDIAVTLAFNVHTLTDREIQDVDFSHEMVSFVPGCFMLNELHSDSPDDQYGARFRYRFVHALFSGKFYESAKLGYFMSKSVSETMSVPLMTVAQDAFSETTCPVPSTGELIQATGISEGETIPGIGARNLFINGVFSPANVYVFPYIESVFTRPEGQSLEDWTKKMAQAYFDGIQAYVNSESAATVLP